MNKKDKYYVGLEREAIRLTKEGEIDQSFHPESFGDKLYNPYITTDFSESQLELITPVFKNNKQALTSLKEILSFIQFKEPSISLHNFSMPPENSSGSIASFGPKGRDKEKYREYLLKKYGLKMQLISGIHYNFSIENLNDEQYLHIIRNVIRYGYILPYLFGNSGHKDYPYATSIRLSSIGYFPKEQQQLAVNFNSKEDYIKSIKTFKSLYSPLEYYLFIRPKFRKEKIQYIELRSLDINPKTETGITIETMEFAKDFLFTMLELPSPLMDSEELLSSLAYHDLICLEGKKEKHKKNIEKVIKDLKLTKPVKATCEKISPKNFLYLDKAVEDSIYKGLECSTRLLIKEALSQNIHIRILDKKTNTIKLLQKNKEAILSQATFTEKDSYISYLLQKDKNITKKLLKEAFLNTPDSITIETSNIDYTPFLGKKICIKPASSNYGNGITIINTTNEHTLKASVNIALTYSEQVLIEEFFKGEEYRFFVIDKKEVFVCKRSPPSVLGNGTSSIKELIEQENKKRDEEFPIKYDGDSSIILEKNKTLLLRENSNICTGGTSKDYTDLMHPGYKEIALKAAAAVNSFLCGVDIIIKDPKTPPTKDNYTILETNFNPALYLHEHPLFGGRKVSRYIFRALGFDTIVN